MYGSLMNDVNYYWVILALVFSFIGIVIRALRWQLLIEPLGFKPSNFNLVNAVIIGYLANIPLPRFGEIARCASLNKTDKIPVDSLIGTVIIERIIDLLTLLILIVIIIVAKIGFFGNFFKEKVFIPWYNTLFISLKFWILILLVVSIVLFILFVFRNKIRKLTFYHKILNFIKGILSGFRTFITMEKRGRFIILTILLWFTYLMMTYVVFFSISSTSNLSLLDGLFILIAGSIGMTAPVQSGFGAYHWMVSLGLMLYGIDQATGLLYATLCHESQIILIIIIGSISMFFVFAGKQKKIKNSAIIK
jgi:glycosyltransferase 2 family protein